MAKSPNINFFIFFRSYILRILFRIIEKNTNCISSLLICIKFIHMTTLVEWFEKIWSNKIIKSIFIILFILVGICIFYWSSIGFGWLTMMIICNYNNSFENCHSKYCTNQYECFIVGVIPFIMTILLGSVVLIIISWIIYNIYQCCKCCCFEKKHKEIYYETDELLRDV